MNSIERNVLELIGEDVDSPDVFTDTPDGMAPIRDSINDAIQEIVMLTGGNKRQYLIPLRSGQAFYRFRLENGNLGWVTDVWDVGRKFRLEQTDLTRLSAYDPRWMVSSGFPEAYMHIGEDVIGFYRKPSASSGEIEITLVEIPSPYESGEDRVKLRDSFKFAAVNYAVGEFWATRGDAEQAARFGNLYLDALGVRDRYTIQGERVPRASTNKEPHPTVTA